MTAFDEMCEELRADIVRDVAERCCALYEDGTVSERALWENEEDGESAAIDMLRDDIIYWFNERREDVVEEIIEALREKRFTVMEEEEEKE